MYFRFLAVLSLLAVMVGATAAPAADQAGNWNMMAVTGNSTVRSMVLWPPNGPGPGSLPVVFGAGGPIEQLWVRIGSSDPWCESLEPIPGFSVPYLEGYSHFPTLTFASPAGALLEPTNAQGYARVALPLHGGGHSVIARSWVLAAPNVTCAWNLNDFLVNSPDINGDLIMNVVDVYHFTRMMVGPYDYRADFDFDNRINLSDLVYFARAYGTYLAP